MKILKPSSQIAPSYNTSDFTRSSIATYVNNGSLNTAAVNEPRFQDGKLLIENSATNLLLRSEEFDNASWVKTNATVTANATTSPSSSVTAEKLIASAVSGRHVAYQAVSTTAATEYTLSVFAKAGEYNFLALSVMQSSNSNGICFVFDLTTKAINRLDSSTGYDNVSSKIETIGSGWYRCVLTFKNASAIVNTVVIAPSPTINPSIDTSYVTASYTGNGTSGIYVWGAQLESGLKNTSYIATTSSTVTRSADVINNTNSALIWTNATDSTPAYSAATTYSVGQLVKYNQTIYESLQNSNLNHTPSTSATWWLSLGADNTVAAFDSKTNSSTTASQNLKFLVVGGLNGLSLLNVDADIIKISVVDITTREIVTYREYGLSNSIVNNWYDYFFNDPVSTTPVNQIAISDINYTNTSQYVFSIGLTGASTVSVGSIIPGDIVDLGATQYGLQAGIVDYSRKEIDEFGNATIVQRPFSKRLSGTVYVENQRLNTVQRLLYSIRATPVVWIASDDVELAEVSIVYGFYKDFSTTISYPDVSMCNLEIEGLI